MLLLLFASSADAAARLDVARVRYGDAVTAERVSIEVDTERNLELRIANAGLQGITLAKLRWDCALTIDEHGRRCIGGVRATVEGVARRGKLELVLDDRGTNAKLSRDRATLALDARTAGDTTLAARDVPIDWLVPLVRRATAGTALDGAKFGDGVVDADVRFGGTGGEPATRTSATTPATVAIDWSLRDLAFDSADGTIAAAGLDASGKVTSRDVAHTAGRADASARAIDFAMTLRAGELLFTPLYVKLPGSPVDVTASLRSTNAGWQVDRWQWSDPGTLEASGTASLASAGESSKNAVTAEVAIRLPTAYDRYLQSMLAPHGLGELTTSGEIRASVTSTSDRPASFEATFTGVDLEDSAGRFAFGGLDGAIAVRRDARTRTLAWQGAALYGIPVGAAKLASMGDETGWRLAEPLALPMLGGRLQVDRFAYAAKDTTSSRIDAALTLDDLSVGELAERFGWPKFGGTLSGKIPAIRSENDQLVFDGGLALDLFDGKVTIDELAMERPFGVAPSLTADIALDDLDLALLTNTFSFGSIEGRLDGTVEDLRLLDWKPVAFDLVLKTDAKRKGKRRISQKAVNSLSSVGGGGAAAGLQSAVMRVFDSFPYAEIGLRCRLANNVCRMGGIEATPSSAAATYTIVRGSGLPHLTVQGFQRDVDWPVLVERLKAATSGATAPIVQ